MNSKSPSTPAAVPQPSGSTGPRTEAGKAISSQNARKHDLCSRTLRLSPEEWVEYYEMRACYGRDLQPADDLEQNLIDEICFNYWRLQQAREVELDIIAAHPAELPVIALYIRYCTGYERGFYKALDKLQQTQRLRKQQTDKQGDPLAAAPPEPVRSEKASESPATASVPAGAPVPPPIPAPVRSENCIPGRSEQLQEQINDHLLENRVRAELLLPPLPLPKPLKMQVDEFVSQNPTLSHKDLNELLRRAA